MDAAVRNQVSSLRTLVLGVVATAMAVVCGGVLTYALDPWLLAGLLIVAFGGVMACVLVWDEPDLSRSCVLALLYVLVGTAVAQGLISHLPGGAPFRFARDVLVGAVLVLSVVLLFPRWLKIVRTSRGLAVGVTLVGIVGIGMSSDRGLALWAFRDGYLYALLALVAAGVGSMGALRGLAVVVVVWAFVNIGVGLLQQFGPAAPWYNLGFYEFATVKVFGLRRAWGTFDRSLTYGHFLLVAALLSTYVLRRHLLGIVFVAFATFSMNRSVLVAGVVILLIWMFEVKGWLARFTILVPASASVIIMGPYLWILLRSMVNLRFRSNALRLVEYASILSLPAWDLLGGGWMGRVGSTAGRFSLQAPFTVGVANIHNGYLTLLLEVGLAGAALAGLSVAYWVWAATNGRTQQMRRLVAVLVGVFALSMLTHNMFTDIPNNLLLWVIIGMIAGQGTALTENAAP